MNILPIQHEDHFIKIYSEVDWQSLKYNEIHRTNITFRNEPTKFPCYGWCVGTAFYEDGSEEQFWAFVYGVNEPTLEEELKTYYER